MTRGDGKLTEATGLCNSSRNSMAIGRNCIYRNSDNIESYYRYISKYLRDEFISKLAVELLG